MKPLIIVGALFGLFVVVGAVALGAAGFAQLRARNAEPQVLSEWELTPAEARRIQPILAAQFAPHAAAYEAWAERQLAVRRGSRADVTALGAQLAVRGFSRLPDAELIAWNEARIGLAEKSPELCAGLWTGETPQRALGRALAASTNAELARWFRITMLAGRLELEHENDPRPVIDQEAPVRFGEQLSNLVSDEEVAEFVAVSRDENTTPDARCRALLLYLRTARRLQPDLKIRVLRQLTAVEITP